MVVPPLNPFLQFGPDDDGSQGDCGTSDVKNFERLGKTKPDFALKSVADPKEVPPAGRRGGGGLIFSAIAHFL